MNPNLEFMSKYTQIPKKVHSQLINKPTYRSNRMHYYDVYEGSNESVFPSGD
jgi:hypothetical protein